MEIKKNLELIFKDVFNDETLELNQKTSASDIENWDSVNNIVLMLAIEKHFSIKFLTHEISKLSNVGDLNDMIEEKLKN